MESVCRPSDPFAPGTMLKKYELLRLLGVGGMAEVHLARTRSMGGFERLVVLKRMRPGLATSRGGVRRFLNEARIAAKLHHANIVQVHDVDEVDGAVFYAMEFLQGHDVRQIVRALELARRPFPLEHAINIGLGVCAGLHHAHEARGSDGRVLGLVHRDVSPHNIVVTFDGTVKIIDFGVAKSRDTPNLTRSGDIRGKCRYMSPEQCLSQPLDRRSDVFAIAIVLYGLTTGRQLFRDLSEYAALKAIVEGDIAPPSCVDRSYPPELERIVMKGLECDRAARYETALAMQLDLEAFARARGLDVSPLSLARFMEALYEDEITAMRTADRKGVSLADHLRGHSRGWRRLRRGGRGRRAVRLPRSERRGSDSRRRTDGHGRRAVDGDPRSFAHEARKGGRTGDRDRRRGGRGRRVGLAGTVLTRRRRSPARSRRTRPSDVGGPERRACGRRAARSAVGSAHGAGDPGRAASRDACAVRASHATRAPPGTHRGPCEHRGASRGEGRLDRGL
jgi:serine/threonine protein kinase